MMGERCVKGGKNEYLNEKNETNPDLHSVSGSIVVPVELYTTQYRLYSSYHIPFILPTLW
jgi:hypothetical protein